MDGAPATATRATAGEPAGSRGRLEVRGLHKAFGAPGASERVLRGIDLVLEPGELLVVVGPSGCGKTTLLHLVAGMVGPDAGEILLDGARVSGPGPDRAIVYQDSGLFPWLTAAQNVEFGLRMAGVGRAERRERAAGALDRVGLSGSAGKLAHELSGGMKQRVAIARALVLDPALLLMDEPFAALDAQTRTMLQGQLQELWCETKKTILFVTHSVAEAARLADRIIVLSAQTGRIRREVAVRVSHPRDFDDPRLAEVAGEVRSEIRSEVTCVDPSAARGEPSRGEAPAGRVLAPAPGGVGGRLSRRRLEAVGLPGAEPRGGRPARDAEHPDGAGRAADARLAARTALGGAGAATVAPEPARGGRDH